MCVAVECRYAYNIDQFFVAVPRKIQFVHQDVCEYTKTGWNL